MQAIEWDVLHDERERQLLVTMSLSTCLSVTAEMRVIDRCYAEDDNDNDTVRRLGSCFLRAASKSRFD
jgi:hypothetical protein